MGYVSALTYHLLLTCYYGQGGAYVLQMLDDCGPSWGLLVIALVETIAIYWIYGNRCHFVVFINKSASILLGSQQ